MQPLHGDVLVEVDSSPEVLVAGIVALLVPVKGVVPEHHIFVVVVVVVVVAHVGVQEVVPERHYVVGVVFGEEVVG